MEAGTDLTNFSLIYSKFIVNKTLIRLTFFALYSKLEKKHGGVVPRGFTARCIFVISAVSPECVKE